MSLRLILAACGLLLALSASAESSDPALTQIDAFIGLMQALGRVEVARSGVVAISRGARVLVD